MELRLKLPSEIVLGELPVAKRGRGRPRKNITLIGALPAPRRLRGVSQETPLMIAKQPAVKRGRGRPRKNLLPA